MQISGNTYLQINKRKNQLCNQVIKTYSLMRLKSLILASEQGLFLYKQYQKYCFQLAIHQNGLSLT